MMGPEILLSKTSFFAMKRTLRLPCRKAGIPASVKSRYPVWLIATTPGPVTGTCSTPEILNLMPCTPQSVRAAAMTVS